MAYYFACYYMKPRRTRTSMQGFRHTHIHRHTHVVHRHTHVHRHTDVHRHTHTSTDTQDLESLNASQNCRQLAATRMFKKCVSTNTLTACSLFTASGLMFHDKTKAPQHDCACVQVSVCGFVQITKFTFFFFYKPSSIIHC